MVHVVSDKWILALIPEPAETDTWLFIRPFSHDAWLLITITVVAIACLLLPYLTLPNTQTRYGYRLTKIIGWLFFMLIAANYDGALTMFFSTPISIPFEDRADVIRAYPAWKLKMKSGSEIHFHLKAWEGDLDFKAFYDRILSQPEETVFYSTKEGMEILQNQKRVAVYLTQIKMNHYLKVNGRKLTDVRTFAEEKLQFSLVLTKNSPLTPVLNFGCHISQENGIMNKLINDLTRRPQTTRFQSMDHAKMVLKPGQVVLVYFIMILAISLALVLLVIEFIFKHIQSEDATIVFPFTP